VRVTFVLRSFEVHPTPFGLSLVSWWHCAPMARWAERRAMPDRGLARYSLSVVQQRWLESRGRRAEAKVK